MPGGGAVSLSGDPLLGHPVVGTVAGHRVPNPLPVGLAPLGIDPHRKYGHPEQIRQPEGPVVHELGGVEQHLDQLLSLPGIGVVQKLPHAAGRRNASGEIQADPAEELGVAGTLGGKDVELSELGEDFIVDEVGAGQLRIVRNPLGHNADPGLHFVAGAADQDVGLTGIESPHQALSVQIGHFLLLGFEAHPVGKVLPRAVRQKRRHDQLPAPSLLQQPFPGKYLQSFHLGQVPPVFLTVRHSPTDPVQDRLVVLRPLLQPQSAPVGNLQGRLPQKQAAFGGLSVDTGNDRLSGLVGQYLEDAALDDPIVVLTRVSGVDGKPEAALALDPGVAGNVVAAPPGEDGPDLFFEGERRRAGRIDHRHGGLGLQGPESHLQMCLPVPCRQHPTGGTESGHRGIGQGELGPSRHVLLATPGEGGHNGELLGGALPPQRGLFGR